jgi:hypothetical protein
MMSSHGKPERLKEWVAAMEHVPEDSLELYSMGRLPEAELEGVEEHLLLCEVCRSRVEELDEFIRTFRETAQVVPVRAQSGKQPKRLLKRLVGGWTLWRPAYGLAGALAVLLVVVAIRQPAPEPGPVSEIHLQAMRSSEVVEAKANTPLNLRLDLSMLAPHPAYDVRIADSRGAVVWRSSVTPRGEYAIANVGGGLRAGQYWVRVYSGAGTLLREYSLRVR